MKTPNNASSALTNVHNALSAVKLAQNNVRVAHETLDDANRHLLDARSETGAFLHSLFGELPFWAYLTDHGHAISQGHTFAEAVTQAPTGEVFFYAPFDGREMARHPAERRDIAPGADALDAYLLSHGFERVSLHGTTHWKGKAPSGKTITVGADGRGTTEDAKYLIQRDVAAHLSLPASEWANIIDNKPESIDV